MSKIFAVANHKGGVGKTTSVASIGACLAKEGYKTLLLDLDGQANLTLLFLPQNEGEGDSIYDSLVKGKKLPIVNVSENLDVVPSSLEMAGAEIAMAQFIGRESVLSRLLEEYKSSYDYIIIDCPPSLSIVTTNAFLASDEILVPMTAELLPLKGMKMLEEFISSLSVVKRGMKISGIFITRYNNRNLNKAVEDAIKAQYGDIAFETRIRENIALAECAGNPGGIFEYDPESNGAKDYADLTREIVEKFGK